MFVEPYFGRPTKNGERPSGWIEVICGSMFSGKTEELIRRINRALIARQKVKVFKPALDTRYSLGQVVSHNKNAMNSIPLRNSIDILKESRTCEVVGIDEAQFFDEALVQVCTSLADEGKRVIVSGLDMDYQGKPFGIMPELICMAEYVTKVHAICVSCGGVASFSHRLSEEDSKILLGEKDAYEPRCRSCFNDATKGCEEPLLSKVKALK